MQQRVTNPDALQSPCIDHGCVGQSNGYTHRKLRGVWMGAHRKVYCEHYNITHLPSWAFIMHICDNPRCINIEHLQLGNARLNMQDKMQKGRHVFTKPPVFLGSENNQSKLTSDTVIEIYKMWLSGDYNQGQIGELFGVRNNTISSIVNGVNWKHLNLQQRFGKRCN